jgi:RND family efflux transporter MFP subunit
MELKSAATGAGVALSVAMTVSSLARHHLEQATGKTPGPPLKDTGYVWAVGKVEGSRQATVSSKAYGRIESYLRQEGDVVQKGMPIVQLERNQQEAELERATVRRDQAQRDAARAQKLWKARSMSAQEREAAETALSTAEADVKALQAALDDHIVKAPFDGTILKTFRDDGENVNPGTPLFAIGDLSKLKLRAEVDELEAARIRVGALAKAWPDAIPDREYRGEVFRIAGMLGRKSIISDDPAERGDAHVLEAEVRLDDAPALRPGMTVRVAVEPSEPKPKP